MSAPNTPKTPKTPTREKRTREERDDASPKKMPGRLNLGFREGNNESEGEEEGAGGPSLLGVFNEAGAPALSARRATPASAGAGAGSSAAGAGEGMTPSRPANFRPLTLFDFDRIRRLAAMIRYAEERGMTEFTFTFLLATGERRRLRVIPGESYPQMIKFGEHDFDTLRDAIYECFELAKEESCSESERESLRSEMRDYVTQFKNLKARIAHLLATKLYYGVLGRISSEAIAEEHFRLSNDSTQRSAGGLGHAYGLYYNQSFETFGTLLQLRAESVLGDESETMEELKSAYRDIYARGKALEEEGSLLLTQLEEMGRHCDAFKAEIRKLSAEHKRLKELHMTKKVGDVEIAQISVQIAEVKATHRAYAVKANEAVVEHNRVAAIYRETIAAYEECKAQLKQIEEKMLAERRKISREKAEIRQRSREAFDQHDRVGRWMDEVEQQIARSPRNPLHAHGLMVVGAKQRCAEAGEELAQLRMFSDAYLGRAYFFDMPREEGATMPYVRYQESLAPPRRNTAEAEAEEEEEEA